MTPEKSRTTMVFVILFLFYCLKIPGQIPGRYFEEVFSTVTETNNVQFSTAVPQPINEYDFYTWLSGGLPLNVKEYETEPVDLKMDIFEPIGDVVEKRPLVILCFGGGFLDGSRDYWSIRLLAQGLARMGYVTASIDYRLGMNIYDQDLGARSVYRAVQDSRSAIRYFRANANNYNIDPNLIFIGGHSAGAFVALHNVYLDKDNERPNSTRGGIQDGNAYPDLGCLDCVGDHLGFSGQANGVFSLAGAIGFLSYIEDAVEAPPIVFHSADDGTVPYGTGKPFSDLAVLIVGEDLPVVHGSETIAKRCDTLGLDYQFNAYTNRGHGVHENGSVALHDDILPKIGHWLYLNYLKPPEVGVEGPTDICYNELIQTYSLDNSAIEYFSWDIDGGNILSGNPLLSTITVEWDAEASMRSLNVLPFSDIGSQGDDQSIHVTVHNGTINTWIGENGNWNNEHNWSNQHIPLSCENIEITNASPLTEIILPADTIIQIRSLNLSDNILLKIPSNTQLDIGESN